MSDFLDGDEMELGCDCPRCRARRRSVLKDGKFRKNGFVKVAIVLNASIPVCQGDVAEDIEAQFGVLSDRLQGEVDMWVKELTGKVQ